MGFFSSKPAPAVLDAPDIEGLRKFARATDRSDPPFFAGRKTEIEEVRTRLADCIQDWRAEKKDAWKGRTTVLQGAPGAGKTALLERISETLKREFEGADLQVCPMEAEYLADPDYSHETLAKALESELWEQAITEVTRTRGGKVDAGAVKGEASRSKATKAPDAWRAFLTLADKNPQALRPVLLLIDEVQNAPGEPKKDGRPATGPAPAFLSMLHKALKNLPVFPLYGGLAHSARRLSDLGLSRTSLRHVRTLDPLAESERREAARGFFAKFRVRGSAEARSRMADAVAEECQGWPQHLHSHLQAIAEGLARDDLNEKGDLDALYRAGLEDFVRERAKENREAYYAERIANSSVFRSRRGLVAAAAVFAGAFENPQIPDMGERLEEISEASKSRRFQLPKGMDGEDFVEAMINGGVLHEDLDGTLSVPIPSFQEYLTTRYGAARLDVPDEALAEGPELSP